MLRKQGRQHREIRWMWTHDFEDAQQSIIRNLGIADTDSMENAD